MRCWCHFLFKGTYYHKPVCCKILIELQCPIPQWGCSTQQISSGKAWVNKHFLEGNQEKPMVFAKVIIPGSSSPPSFQPSSMDMSQMHKFQICLWYSELLGCISYQDTIQVVQLHCPLLSTPISTMGHSPWLMSHGSCVTRAVWPTLSLTLMWSSDKATMRTEKCSKQHSDWSYPV